MDKYINNLKSKNKNLILKYFKRRIRGINTDVWIAPRGGKNWNGTFEWHFMADGWIIQESTAIQRNEPILLLLNLNIKTTSGNVSKIV